MKRAYFLSFAAALLLLQGLFAAAYVAHERTVYFWDHAMYHAMARALAAAFDAGAGQGFTLLGQSLSQDYNYLFTLPSLFSFSLFGAARPVFVLTNFIVYFVAFEAAVAFVLRRIFNIGWPAALFLGFAVCTFIPPLWLPLLEGYPDVGAAACVAFALGMLLNPAHKFRDAVSAGLLLGLAVLLRRHFAYISLVLLPVFAAGGFFSSLFFEAPQKRWRKIMRLASFFALCGAVTAAVICVVAPAFFIDALTFDYGSLYLSYKRPAAYFLIFALSGFGFLLSAVTVGGFALAARIFPDSRRALVLASCVALVWLIVWCIGPSQAGHHYILHILPLFVAIGIAGLFLSLSRLLPGRNGFAVCGALAIMLAVNGAWALWLSPYGVRPNYNGPPGFFSAPRPPVVREDYDELARLASYLAAATSPQDRIFVLGSSFIFNQDLVRVVFTDVLRRAEPLSRFVYGPEIDSRGISPVNAFAAATVYVVPEPPQYHLDPGAQKVIAATARQFPPPPERAGLFRKDDRVFRLEDGVEVSVWRRVAPWPPDSLQAAITEMRQTLEGH